MPSHHSSDASTKALISGLTDPDVDVRSTALQALLRRHDLAACEAIVSLLNDPVAQVRRAAIYIVGELRCPQAKEKLAALAASLSDDTDLITLLLTLRKLGVMLQDSVLRSALDRESPTVRAHALRSLTDSSSPKAAETLGQHLLHDPAAVVRAAAAASLENFPDEDTVRLLTQSLADPESGVRIEGIRSLGFMRSPTAITPLIASRANEQDDRIVSEINSALVRLNPSTFSALLPPGSAASLYDPTNRMVPATVWLRDPLWYPASEHIVFFNTGTAETVDSDGEVVRFRYSAEGSHLQLVEVQTSRIHEYDFQIGEAVWPDHDSSLRPTQQVAFSSDPVTQRAERTVYLATPGRS